MLECINIIVNSNDHKNNMDDIEEDLHNQVEEFKKQEFKLISGTLVKTRTVLNKDDDTLSTEIYYVRTMAK